MTLPEFLKKLRKTPGPWKLRGDAIRCKEGCPLSVVGRKGPASRWAVAAYELGIRPRAARLIVSAADYPHGHGVDPALRQQLLAATVERS